MNLDNDDLLLIFDALNALGDHTERQAWEGGLLTRLCDELKARGYTLNIRERVWSEAEEEEE